ncbi:PaaI family thioesterase [Marinovum sp.]|uniref:PaaI family thioesterase n=1 Tax=Marinovum sp. TaxID=2024839 RepID=UPI002B266703|nr:PaaI family thioesterase [Marinovum sp.]
MTLSRQKEADLRESFARQSLMRTFSAELSELAAGRVEVRAPIGPGVLQQHGFGHAGLTFALGDTAAGYAALTQMPEGAEVLTAEIKINLLAPARGQSLRARGEVLKPGRRLVVVRASVWALDGDTETEIAALQGTMVPVLPGA